jgi:hypothetical protein
MNWNCVLKKTVVAYNESLSLHLFLLTEVNHEKNIVRISGLWARELNPVNTQIGRKWRCRSDCKISCFLFRSERLVIFPTRTVRVYCSSYAQQSTPALQLLFWTVPCQLWPFILRLLWNTWSDLAVYNISNFRYRARSKRPAWQTSVWYKEPKFIATERTLALLRRIRKIAKASVSFRHVSPSFVPSVRLSVHMEQLIPNWADFHKIVQLSTFS